MPRSRRFSAVILLSTLFVLAGFAPPAAALDREPGWIATPEENPNFVVYDLPAVEIENRLAIPYEEMVRRRAGITAQVAPDTGVALILLCQWEDDPADTVAHPPEAYDTLLFTQGAVSTGSMREYFLEVSYGGYWIEGEVHGWYTRPTYQQNLWFTDFFAAADPFIDYSQFDRDNNGYTDAVWIFHAGPGQEETHDPSDIWSFAVWGLNYMTDDGVIIDRFSCNPEMHADGSIISIRVPSHEAAHVLGLPDLYDYDSKLDTTTYYTPGDDNDHPLVDWCLMGYYGYNIMSYGTRQDPSHLCSWSKVQLGYVTPVELIQSQHNIPVPEAETTPAVYKFDSPGAGSQEYFLLENRNSNSSAIFDHLDSDFSAYFPWFTPGQNQKDPGLLILHVDDAVSNNSRGPNNPHYKVIVEDAGYDPARAWDGQDEFSDWWYPYELRIGAPFAAEDSGQTSFTPLSIPSSAWYGGPSGIWITNISASDSVMTFDLGFGNAWPAIVDHFPVSLDTTLDAGELFLFSVAAMDEDGGPITYDWHKNGSPVQAGPDSSYWFTAGLPDAVDTLLAVATDGLLADSLTWIVHAGVSTSIAGGVPTVEEPILTTAPTPFNPAVTIRCLLPQPGRVRLTIHDMRGRLVTVLLDSDQDGGTVTRVWEGKSRSGKEAASGVYFVRLEAGGVVSTSRVVLLR